MYEVIIGGVWLLSILVTVFVIRKREKEKELALKESMEKEIAKAKTAMLQEKAIRQEFFVNVTHELKTPLTSIKGYTELLAQGFVEEETEKEEFYKRILTETKNMCELIEDSMEISKLESREVCVKKTQIRLCLLLEEVLDSLQVIADRYQVVLHKECEPLTIQADVNQITVLLKNLIVNAIKYNRPGGEVWVHILKQNSKIMLIVKDNGIGIEEEEQQHIFERFYRVDKGRCKKTGGTGLGLSIVKHIVEYNEGSIELESHFGKGSRFVVWLPMSA